MVIKILLLIIVELLLYRKHKLVLYVHARCPCCVQCQQCMLRPLPTVHDACSANNVRCVQCQQYTYAAFIINSTPCVQCQQYTLRAVPTVHAAWIANSARCVQCQQCTLRAVPTVHAACSDWYFCNRRMKLKLRICRQSFRKCFAKLQ